MAKRSSLTQDSLYNAQPDGASARGAIPLSADGFVGNRSERNFASAYRHAHAVAPEPYRSGVRGPHLYHRRAGMSQICVWRRDDPARSAGIEGASAAPAELRLKSNWPRSSEEN